MSIERPQFSSRHEMETQSSFERKHQPFSGNFNTTELPQMQALGSNRLLKGINLVKEKRSTKTAAIVLSVLSVVDWIAFYVASVGYNAGWAHVGFFGVFGVAGLALPILAFISLMVFMYKRNKYRKRQRLGDAPRTSDWLN